MRTIEIIVGFMVMIAATLWIGISSNGLVIAVVCGAFILGLAMVKEDEVTVEIETVDDYEEEEAR